MIPDTVVYQKLVKLKKAPNNLFVLNVGKLSIKNIGARKAYEEKILDIDNISIDKPDLTIISKRYAYNDSLKVGKPKTPYQVIQKIFKQLTIDSILLKDISVNYINKNNAVTKQTALKHIDIAVSDIHIDSLSAADPKRFYYTKGIEVTVHDYHLTTPDNLYTASVKRLYFSTALRKIVLDKVSFLPRYSYDRFYKIVNQPTDIFSLKSKRIDLDDIDLQRFLGDQKLYTGTMNIKNADVKIYHDNSYQGVKTIKTGKDPHQALQKLALDMKLTRLNISNSTIVYAEADKKSGYTGMITFNNTTAHFNNVTNDDDAKKENQFMTANIVTSFMNAAPLKVIFKFNLADKNGAFTYAGSLKNLDGRKLDKLLKPLVMIHVKSADIERLDFAVNANNYNGKGKLEFYYKNLKVDILKKTAGVDTLQKQGFISKLANTLVIKSDNPDKKGNFRPGPIDLKRDPTVSFFSFLYKCLLEGLKPSVGVSKKTENDLNKVTEMFGSKSKKAKKK